MADEKADRLDEIIASHSGREGPMLPILHDIQEEYGCIEDEAKRRIAAALNLSRAEVHGVVSFYHDFKAEKAHKPVLKLCRAESCKARGVEALVAHAEATAGDRVEIPSFPPAVSDRTVDQSGRRDADRRRSDCRGSGDRSRPA